MNKHTDTPLGQAILGTLVMFMISGIITGIPLLLVYFLSK
jgi:hypothetical protein